MPRHLDHLSRPTLERSWASQLRSWCEGQNIHYQLLSTSPTQTTSFLRTGGPCGAMRLTPGVRRQGWNNPPRQRPGGHSHWNDTHGLLSTWWGSMGIWAGVPRAGRCQFARQNSQVTQSARKPIVTGGPGGAVRAAGVRAGVLRTGRGPGAAGGPHGGGRSNRRRLPAALPPPHIRAVRGAAWQCPMTRLVPLMPATLTGAAFLPRFVASHPPCARCSSPAPDDHCPSQVPGVRGPGHSLCGILSAPARQPGTSITPRGW